MSEKRELKIILTDEQIQKLEDLSETTGLSKQDILRYNTFGPSASLKKPNTPLLNKIIGLLGQLGNNLNQSQKVINEKSKSGDISSDDFHLHNQILSETSDEIKKIRESIVNV